MNAQLCTSTALNLGAALITSTAITTVFLANAGISPTLVILLLFLPVCLCLSKKTTNTQGRMALAFAGTFGALMCHFMLSWFITITP